jgi:hypothetical protein
VVLLPLSPAWHAAGPAKLSLILLLLGASGGHCLAQSEPREIYKVTQAAHCVSAENLNGLLFLHNACEQEVRAYWCAQLQDDAPHGVEPASCSVMAVAESKASVEIEPKRSAALVVPKLGGNLQVQQVRQVHLAVCRLSTRELNVPHHFELSYTGSSVTTKCLEKTPLKAGQRTRVVELQLVPDQPAQQVRLLVAPE